MMCVAPDFSGAGHRAAERYLSDSVCPDRKAALARNLERLPEEIAAAPDRAFVTYCLLMAPLSWYDYNYDATALWEGVEVNMTMFDFLAWRSFSRHRYYEKSGIIAGSSLSRTWSL